METDAMRNTGQYFRLELDDYALPPICDGSKYYFGTLEELRGFMAALEEKKTPMTVTETFFPLSALMRRVRPTLPTTYPIGRSPYSSRRRSSFRKRS